MSKFRHTIDWEAMDYDDGAGSKISTANESAPADGNADGAKTATTDEAGYATRPTSASSKGGARGGTQPLPKGRTDVISEGINGPASEELSSSFKIPANQTLKGRIEAVLFMTGKALSPADIAEIVIAPTEEVELALVELMGDYGFREDSALEIDDTDGYILQVKEEYSDIVNRMMPLEMSAAELRTLSAIAIKAPVLQTDIIEWRGASAYEHIASLLKRKLISKRREGRTYILNITKNFHEYFKLTADKKDLAQLVQLIGKENGASDTDDPGETGDMPSDTGVTGHPTL